MAVDVFLMIFAVLILFIVFLTGGNIWISVSYLRSIYNILVYIWFGIFGDGYGFYCKVS